MTPPPHSRSTDKNTGLFNQLKPQNPSSDKPRGNGGDNDDSNLKPEPKSIVLIIQKMIINTNTNTKWDLNKIQIVKQIQIGQIQIN